MKKLSLVVLILFVSEFIFQPVWAHSAPDSNGPEAAPFVASANEVPERSSESKPSRDEEILGAIRKRQKFAFTDLPRHLGYDIRKLLGLGLLRPGRRICDGGGPSPRRSEKFNPAFNPMPYSAIRETRSSINSGPLHHGEA
jgi:hypothetical protein